ncbi:MAG: hypothetical protein PHH14_06690 [Candidatus Margulisbacteria bacterium]|nr:hypothetical protein [Candidatus Margulisiibacteriota bacterium]
MRSFVVFALLTVIAAGCAVATVDLNGYVGLDEKILTENNTNSYFWNRATLGLKAYSPISQWVLAYGEVRFRTLDGSSALTTVDLANRDKVSPYELELREAYIDFIKFPYKFIDTRVGKQRIDWDNFDPYDLSDPLDYTEKIPTNALKFKATLGESVLSAVAIPVFVPSLMSSNYLDYVNDHVRGLTPAGQTLSTIETSVTLPAGRTDNSMFGVRWEKKIMMFNASLSYFNGRDSIPNFNNITFTSSGTGEVAGRATLDYPKIEVVSYDLKTELKGIGFWIKGGFYKPNNVIQQVFTPTSAATTETPNYTKYVIGTDFSLPNGFYVNAQLVHGFFDERGGELNNYIQARTEKILLDGSAKFTFAWLGEWQNRNVVGNLFNPELSLYPTKDSSIAFGSYSIYGEPGSRISQWNPLDQVYLKFNYNF